MDPMMWLLPLLAGTNPGLLGTALDATGVAPPIGGMMGLGGESSLGALLGGAAGSSVNPLDQAMREAPVAGGLGAAPTASPPPTDPMKTLQTLATLKGVKAPEPVKPVFSGGITGAGRAPEASAAGVSGRSPAIEQILALLMNRRGGGTPVGTLGSFLGGR